MKVLVTGASGYLGQFLLQALAQDEGIELVGVLRGLAWPAASAVEPAAGQDGVIASVTPLARPPSAPPSSPYPERGFARRVARRAECGVVDDAELTLGVVVSVDGA